MNKFFKKGGRFSLLEMLIVVASIAILAAFFIPALQREANAQPYFTNTGTIYGAQTYNQNFTPPLAPSKVLANQYAAGTLAGSLPPAAVASNAMVISFSTNIFSTAPFVCFSLSATNGYPTNAMPAVTAVTTTNVTIWTPVTNCSLYWEATGH
jgi:hypothetical protein